MSPVYCKEVFTLKDVRTFDFDGIPLDFGQNRLLVTLLDDVESLIKTGSKTNSEWLVSNG